MVTQLRDTGRAIKSIETRNRRCHYRGDVAIVATQKTTLQLFRAGELSGEIWVKAGIALGAKTDEENTGIVNLLPRGVIVGVVEIYDCQPSELAESIAETNSELLFGNYAPGRYGWLTRNPRKLETPIPVRGAQGWFNLPPDVADKVRKQIA